MNKHGWKWGLLGGALGFLVVALLPAHTLFKTPPDTATAGLGETGTRYACPMMDYIGHQPGNCPVCGMKLQPVTAGSLQREQQQRMGLETTQVTQGPAQVNIRAYGTATYDHRFTKVVIPRVAGRIVKRYEATYGCCAEVAEGAPIIDLYSPDVIAAQGELLAAVKIGETNLIHALRQRFVLWNLDHVAENALRSGQVRDIITLHSAYTGQVLLNDFELVNEALEVGLEIMPDTPLLRLVDPDKLVLVVHVPEPTARFLSEGQAVAIDSDDRGPLPDIKAVVDRVAPEIDPQIRAREVRIYLRGARHLLMPGSLVSARIKGVLGPDLKPADPDDPTTWGQFALVPKTAVLSTGVRNVAWRVAERPAGGRLRFEIAPLALGPRLEDESGNDLYVVRAGLMPGDEVATQGAFLIDSQAQLAGSASLLFPHGATAPSHTH